METGGATLQGKVTVGQVCRIEKVVNKTWIIYLGGPQYTLGTMPT